MIVLQLENQRSGSIRHGHRRSWLRGLSGDLGVRRVDCFRLGISIELS
jgi:hypothetical protein